MAIKPILKTYMATGEEIKDDICFIVGSNGVFQRIKNQHYEITRKVDGLVGLEEVKEAQKCHLPQLPRRIIDIALEFFKTIKNECCILLYYKDGEWDYAVPKQTVSAASIEYEMEDMYSERDLSDWQLMGTIHSHNTMNAFFSGTDDDDQLVFDGFHLVCGKVHSAPEWEARVVMNSVAIKVDMDIIIEKGDLDIDLDKFKEQVNERVHNHNRSWRDWNKFDSNSTQNGKKSYSNRRRQVHKVEHEPSAFSEGSDWDEQSYGDDYDIYGNYIGSEVL